MPKKESEPLNVLEDDPIEESSQPKPTREVWTATFYNLKMPAADPLSEKRVNVLAARFRLAAIKADNWMKKNPEFQIRSLIYSPDTVI